MTTDNTSIITDIIRRRRTTKPDKMNGRKIEDTQINVLLEAADWAPNHGLTEPWRFVVYSDDGLPAFCHQHAEMYRLLTPSENFIQAKYDKLLNMGSLASHIIIVINQRGNLPGIPPWEEMAATACAIQNILLTATAMGIASFWSTGGMALHPGMKNHLQLRQEDHVAGILYLGYADTQPAGKRNIPLAEKVKWVVR